MKFWKSKKFIAAVTLAAAMGTGMANPTLVSSTATGVYCNIVECE